MTPRMSRRTLLGGILGLCVGIPAVALADDVEIFPDDEVIVPPGEEESGCFDADMAPVDCEPVATVVTTAQELHEGGWTVVDVVVVDPVSENYVVVALPRTGTGH